MINKHYSIIAKVAESMKRSIISNSDEVKDTSTMLVTFNIQGNVKFQLEGTEHKDVIFCPFKIIDLLQW